MNFKDKLDYNWIFFRLFNHEPNEKPDTQVSYIPIIQII